MKMREILFRGKMKKDNTWCYGNLCVTCGCKYIVSTNVFPLSLCGEINPETVGEYTGLTDKNGVKVFEGDILRCVSEDWNNTYITKVWAYGNTLCVDVNGEANGYAPIDFADEIWVNENYEIEVIGNAYDNPNLLKE